MILQARKTTQTLSSELSRSILKIKRKMSNHPSILKIKRKMSNKGLGFSFKYVIRNKIVKEMQNLDSKKTCQESDIPVKLIKNLDVISPFVYNNYNNFLFSSCFPSKLKNANVPKMCLFSKRKRSI